MSYEEFNICISARLQGFLGKDAVITTEKVLKNNGQSYYGMRIARTVTESTIPVIYMDRLYEAYGNGSMTMEECVREVCRIRKKYECTEDILQFADKLSDWEFVKENVYPILLSTEENRELLQKLVSTPLLDLSVVYMIREDKEKCVKISKAMMDSYGIDKIKLHRQAVENMKKDGYKFQDMEELIMEIYHGEDFGEDILPFDENRRGKMYVLTNRENLYGAAGILDKTMIREFAGNRNFFILPSSLHEIIFVPDDDGLKGKEFDEMVAEINETVVRKEDKLSDHSYYYDAQEDEIRICN